MKRSLFACLLVFSLVQSEAIAALSDRASSMDWEPRADRVRELIEMVRGRRIPTVMLTLVNKANVPTRILSAAKLQVETIYQRAGVHVVWDHPDQSNTIQLTVVIVRNCV